MEANARKPKTLLFVINSLEGGGAERVLCKVVNYLATSFDYDIHLLLLDTLEECYDVHASVKKYTCLSQGSLGSSLKNTLATVKKVQPDLIFSFLTRSNLVSTIAARTFRVPNIISERVNTTSHLGNGGKASISKMLIKSVYPLANKVVAVSEGVKQDLVANYRVSADKVDVVYNPYNIKAICELADSPADSSLYQWTSEPYMVAVGRLVANKNFSLLIDAYAKALPSQKLLILGEGGDRESLTGQIRALGLEDRILMPGFVATPYCLMKNADMFISSSNSEGFPNGIVEAMCLGKPIIATNCQSGPAEILAEDHNLKTDKFLATKHGIITPVNDKDELAAAINHLSDADERQKYSNLSINRSYDFEEKKSMTGYISVIEGLLKQKASSMKNSTEEVVH